jgi:hypothetical protein
MPPADEGADVGPLLESIALQLTIAIAFFKPFPRRLDLFNDPPTDVASLITQVLRGCVSGALCCGLTTHHPFSRDTSTAG